MKGYVDNIEQVTLDNTDFRRVLYTGHNLQLVAMSINPGEEIGAEAYDSGRFPEAIALFRDLSTAPALASFLTLPAYPLLEGQKQAA